MTPSRRAHLLATLFTAVATALVVPAAHAAIAVDATATAWRDTSGSVTSLTSPAFATTAPNELLLAFVSTDSKTSGMTVTGITGSGLTWTLVRRTNVQLGTSEIWRAFAPAPLASVTVVATLSQKTAASLWVVGFTGVDASGGNGAAAIGATAGANANPGAPSATLVTTRDNSWVWGVGNDWDRATARSLGPGQTMVHQYLATVGDTYWLQRQTSTTPLRGTSVTINDVAPANDRYNLSVVEILPPAGPTYTISGTITPDVSGVGTLVTLSGAAGASVTADPQGRYSFGGLSNGDYVVTPLKTGFTFAPLVQNVTVSGADRPNVDFAATAVPTYVVSGNVGPAAAGGGTLLTLSGTPSATTTANASGNYTFSGLPSGSFTVTPSKSGYTFTPVSQPITIGTADVTGVNFTATPLPPPPLNYPDLTDIVPAAEISITGSGASRMFQYTHLTFNGGNGPLVIQPVYRPASGNYQGIQYLYRFSGGTWTRVQQTPMAGAFIFHAVHGHFHYPFATYGLYAVAAGGGIGAPVALSEKIGFCIADSYIYAPNLPNAGALGNLGSCSDPLSLRGLDIGAVDEYDARDDGQSISIADLPDGTYWLRAIVDPDNFIVDGDPANNETDVKLTITGTTVQVLETVTPVLAPPPAIALTAPADAAALSGTVTLTATTTETTGVQFLVDGQALGGPVAGPAFSLDWNTTTLANGVHWLAAQTTNAAGRVGTSAVATVTVSNAAPRDTIPPFVTLADPEPGDTVSASVSIGAIAADNSGIASVRFYVDGLPVGSTVTTPPYMTFWNTVGVSDGTHMVSAAATDSAGLVGVSEAVPVIVDNSHPFNVIGTDVTISVTGAGVLQTAAFSTATPNDLLVAFVSYDGPSTSAQTATVSGAGLSWLLVKRSNVEHGTAEIWTARANGRLTNATVLSQPGAAGYRGALTVIAFTNSSGPGVAAQASAPTGAPDIFVPGVAAGSWVFAAGTDWDRAVARTPVSGQTLVYQRLDTTVNDTYWVQSTLAPNTAFALVTIHDNAPTNDRWNYAAVEIVATRGSGPNTKPTATLVAPAPNAFYFTGQTINLSGSGTDLESPPTSLAFDWVVDLVFGSHVQPAYQTFSGATASYAGANLDDGTGVREVIKLTARDPQGLTSDTASVTIWPEIDLVPTAVTVSPDPVVSGQSARFTFALNNTGRMPAPASRWVLRAGATVLGQGDVAVAANGSASLTVDAVMPTAGNFPLRLRADSLGAVFETSEANNATMRTLTVNAPSVPFPQTAVLDNFDRANGAVGGSWIDMTTRFTINGNAVAPLSGDNYIEWGPTSFGPNQEAFVTLSTIATSAPEQNLMLKTQGSTWTTGHIEVCYNHSASRVVVYTYTPTTKWATAGTISNVRYAAGDQFGARAFANGQVQVFKNGVQVGAVSAASWAYAAQGGRIGLSVSNATAARFDNFGGGTIPGALALAGGDESLASGVAPEVEALPAALSLSPAFPNPSRDGVAFRLALPTESDVSLEVFDIEGRHVWSEPARSYGAGRWTLAWDGRSPAQAVRSGVYMARVRIGAERLLRRFVIVR